ncbi:hypothetical protein RHMOL_Rhmol10G0204300 [Rhododendron molle]|uniref:Uncharacterized protein n=1 Tax=Rhododendron molle TaxID=49168 RepID=A0ACC0M5G7_RHOML|nr:hypothetical protein RHMOL_Rhmol10G0204300 [Rhododendron molle]
MDPSTEVAGSVVTGSGSGDTGHGGDGRSPEAEPRTTEEAGVVESSVEPLGSGTVVEGSPVVGGSSGDAGGSGAEGGDVEAIGSPPRDRARGKWAVVEEEMTEALFVYREENVLFRPVVTSSSHWPITKQDVAEQLSDEALAKLLEDSPAFGELVWKAKEDQARAIAASEAAERAERERKEREEPLRDAEAEERAGVEVQWPRVTAVAEAGASTRLDFQRRHMCLLHLTCLCHQLWAYEVLQMYPPMCKHPDLSTLPRALIWSKGNMGTKEGKGDLNAFRLYLDDLRASQINWNPWRVAEPEPEYRARSRAVTVSRVLLESAFGWLWYLGDRVTR